MNHIQILAEDRRLPALRDSPRQRSARRRRWTQAEKSGFAAPFLRRLFWVYGAFIVLVIISFGTLTLMHGGELAAGTPLGRALCLFIGIFWLARLLVQLFVFDARPFLTGGFTNSGITASPWCSRILWWFTGRRL